MVNPNKPNTKICRKKLARTVVCEARCRPKVPPSIFFGEYSDIRFPAARFMGSAKSSPAKVVTTANNDGGGNSELTPRDSSTTSIARTATCATDHPSTTLRNVLREAKKN